MTNPTNTDLAAALREIADTLPLGSALVVRLAADRLDEDKDGWIEWDPRADNASDGPDVPSEAIVELKFGDGSVSDPESPKTVDYWRSGYGTNNWSHHKDHLAITAYRIVK